MAEPDLSFIRPEVSLEEMRALDRRRLMAILNGMIMRMSEWIGEMAKKGEEQLMKAERRLEKADIKLRLLEIKLQAISIDGDEKTAVTVVDEKKNTVEEEEKIEEKIEEKKEEEIKVEEDKKHDGMMMKDDPRYSKYFKMVKMGIQEEAVRLKMSSEGVDPSILNNPNAVSDAPMVEEEGHSSDESVGSFTDSE